MRINTDMLFNELADKLSPFILNEKYYKYQPPTGNEGKELMMYDFYVLDYLNSILPYPSVGFRDLNPDLEDSVKDSVNTLYPYLKNELLNVVFYAVCAEMRHAYSNFGTGEGFRDKMSKIEYNLYKTYLKYIIYHGKTASQKEELKNVFNVRKPSSEIRTPESERSNDSVRNLSYKAANYAVKKTGLSRKEFIEVAEIVFTEGNWPTSYGGRAWAGICSGWLLLDRSDSIDGVQRSTKSNSSELDKKLETDYDKNKRESEKSRRVEKSTKVEPMGVAIDHVYDLQHNTDTVFNKLKSYYNSSKGYSWIAAALDHKANVETYHELLDKCSGVVGAMALPVLYNKLGTNWEEEILKERPKSSATPEIGDRFKDEDGYENVVTYSRNNVIYKRTYDNQKGRVTLEDFINKIKNGKFKYSTTNKNAYIVDDPENLKISNPSVGNEVKSNISTTSEPYTNATDKNTKVGDMIKCIDGDDVNSLTTGKIYKVEKLNYDYFYIIDDSGVEGGWMHYRFVKVTPETTQKDIQLSVGDIIKSTGTANTYTIKDINGKYVTLQNNTSTDETNSTKRHIIQKIKDGLLGYQSGNNPPNSSVAQSVKGVPDGYDRVSISDATDLKRGDLLIANPSVDTYTHRKNIKSGVVVKFHSTYGDVDGNTGVNVVLNGKLSQGFPMKDFDKLIPNKSIPQSDIKKGDMVKCIDNNDVSTLITLNKIYKVKKIGATHLSVITDKGTENTFYISRFVKVDSEADTTSDRRKESDYYKAFKVGDIVTPRDVISLQKSGYAGQLIPGKEYVISKIDPPKDDLNGHGWKYALLDVTGGISAYAKRFKLVKKATSNGNNEPNKNFDGIIDVGDKFQYLETTYEILDINMSNRNEQVRVKNLTVQNVFLMNFKSLHERFKDGTYTYIPKSEEQKLTQVDSIKKSRPKERILDVGDYVTYKSLSTNKELSGVIISINNGEAYVHFAKQRGLDATSEWIHLTKLKKDIKI